MIGISQSLLRGQRARSILGKHLLIRCVLTYGANTYTYNTTRIKQLSRMEQIFSHKSELMLDDTDKVLHGLDLEGYKVVISRGLITRAGEEWVDLPPLWVIGQQRDSYRDRLECSLSLEGTFDRMGRHKATDTYTPDSGDTRTVKDWLIELITLGTSGSASTEEQTTSDSDMPLHSGVRYGAGQKLTISGRRLARLYFKLKKVGSPSGEVAFSIYSVTTGALLVRRVWGDAFNLGTSYGWQYVTLYWWHKINEEVRIVCEFQDGDSSNYVDMAYNETSVKASQELTEKYTGDWSDEAGYDAAYKYTYGATPVYCYDKYPAYGLVFDSEDDLIDSFIPADSFRINLNDTRLAKVKELMRYTDCVAVVKNDGLIHISVPTTSGTTYDNEYTLVQGRDYHNFFNKRFRRRVVSPNYIIFKDYDGTYIGYAKDASADLTDMLEQETHTVRATSAAQCTNLATAYLSKLQMESEKGSGVLPFVHFGQELYDYVNFVDARAGDNRAGNVGSITEFYKPGQFNMSIGFGRTPIGVRALQGYGTEAGLSIGALKEALFQLQDWLIELAPYVEQNQENIKILFDAYNSRFEDGYFKKLTATERLRIPSGTDMYGDTPVGTTEDVSSIAATTAIGNGTIRYLGFPSSPTAHGVCWDTSRYPTITDSGSGEWGKTDEGTYSGDVPYAFTTTMAVLTTETTYYVRTYVTNAEGTTYGLEVEFTTL